MTPNYDQMRVEELAAQLTAARRALAAATQRAEAAEAHAITWIPVADRLPAPELRVLACYNDGRMTIILRAFHLPPRTALCYGDYEEPEYDEETGAAYYPGGWYEATNEGDWSFVGPMAGTVTHWTKLPKLPEVQP